MPIMGDIKNLYSDKNQSRALFPTTKIKAVSDDDGKGLNAVLDDMTAHTRKVGNPYNLLDNSDFRNPVNQRGASGTYSAWGGYTIDRWRLNNAETTLSFVSDGLQMKGIIEQYFENPAKLSDKKLTVAAKVNGTVYCSSGTVSYINAWKRIARFLGTGFEVEFAANANNALSVALIATSSTLFEWVAVYEGEYIAETLPEYQPKEYAVDLTECRRYYRPYSTWSSICTGYIDWQGYLTLYIPTDTPMRITPSCGRVQASIIVDGAYINIDETPSSVRQLNGVIYLIFTNTQHSEHVSRPCVLSMGDYPIVLSAEL